MKPVVAIARRELESYLAGPLGWLCLFGFVGVTGLFFALILTEYNIQAASAPMYMGMEDGPNLDEWVVQPFFANTGVILLLLCPALSMRLFAEDRRQRSLELLMSSPLRTSQIVLGKYLGALGFLGVLLGATLHYALILVFLGEPDVGILASCYASTFLLSAAFLAVGMLTSAFTENQVVALVLGFGLLMVLWVLTWAESFAP
ncbi:MAG: ABC transporter permease, partial [Myxococcota bacterium]|nr:ABC transporter permease [Myxococcota bacterium]